MVEHQIGVITHFTHFFHRSSLNNNTLAPIHEVSRLFIYFSLLKLIIIVFKVTHARYRISLTRENYLRWENLMTPMMARKKIRGANFSTSLNRELQRTTVPLRLQ